MRVLRGLVPADHDRREHPVPAVETPSPGDLRHLLAEVRAGAARLRSVPTAEVIERVSRIVQAWLQPGSKWMQVARSGLPEATGFHPAMIAHALPFQLEFLTAESIRRLIEREFGSLSALDNPDWPLRLVVHVMAGNIPALAAVPMVLGVVAKQATVIKPASGDPLFPYLFEQSLRALDPELAAAVSVISWRGGASKAEETVFAEADVVVAMGGADAMSALHARLGKRVRAYGPRLSFAVVCRDCLATPAEARIWAQALAYDASLWDQRGCLSPQIAFVERGGAVPVKDFASMVAEAMASWCIELPPRSLTIGEQLAVRAFRDSAEWEPGTEVLASCGNLNWTVTVEPQARFLPTPQHRCLRLQPVAAIEELAPMLGRYSDLLEGAGVAAGPERRPTLERLLENVGVHWVATLGSIQRPTLEWRPGGRDRVREWL